MDCEVRGSRDIGIVVGYVGFCVVRRLGVGCFSGFGTCVVFALFGYSVFLVVFSCRFTVVFVL